MKKLVCFDHTFIQFRNYYRDKKNFVEALSLTLDCDNHHSERQEDWIDFKDIPKKIPDVAMILYSSRNHWRQKGKYSPRPRFHVVFLIPPVTSPENYAQLMREIQTRFSFFDQNALDSARFFYGSPDSEVSFVEGSRTVTDYLNEETLSHMGEEIGEGSRNNTMFLWAVRNMKRYGDTAEVQERFYQEAEKCSPPLEVSELETIWRSAGKYYEKISKQPGYVQPEKYNNPKEWEEPIPFSRSILPRFPLEALPPPFANYAAAVAKSTQTPVDMACCTEISVLSTCLQGKYRIFGKADWHEPMNTYMLEIAPPSERKSPVQNLMMRPVDKYEMQFNRQNAALVESSKMQKRILERRQKMVEDQVVKGKANQEELDRIAKEIVEFREFKPIRLYVDDITTEKLVTVIAENGGKAALISSEGGIFDNLAGIYTKNVNIDVMLKGYSGDTIRVDRIGRESESIMNPALTVLLMAQPSVVSEVMSNKTFRGRGLTARFLYCMPETAVGTRTFESAPIPEEVYQEYERCVFDLLNDECKNEAITLSPEARHLLAKFSDDLEPKLLTEYADMSDWAGKLVGNILRISGLLYRASVYRSFDFLEEPQPLVVDAQTMRHAICIGRYFLSHAKAVYSILPDSTMYKKAERILKWLKEENITEFSRRDAMRKCRTFKAVSDIQPVLDFLEDYGHIGMGQSVTKNPRYLVNPWLHEH